LERARPNARSNYIEYDETLMPANRHAPLVSREPLGGAYFILTFRHPEVAASARAGQFVMIKAGLSAEPPLRRPFSVLSVDAEEETFSLFVKAVGDGTRALTRLSPGELAQCLGPLGRPFTAPAPGTEAVMVAGGYGIAPFHLFARELGREGGKGRVFYGGRTAGDLKLCDRFDGLLPLLPATEDGSLGRPGRVTAPLLQYLEEKRGPVKLYACGPDAMLHAVAQLATGRGLEAEVSLDPWMGCGIGTCLGCVVRVQRPEEARAKFRCACTEGPVFDASVVVWPGETASAARRRVGVEA
jgi:dihydroorotate dehydrogenase electron transfer subunit